MVRNILEVLYKLVNKYQSAQPVKQAEPDGGLSTRLYSCPDCETTYISERMESCSTCNERVEQIPSERDLGFYRPE